MNNVRFPLIAYRVCANPQIPAIFPQKRVYFLGKIVYNDFDWTLFEIWKYAQWQRVVSPDKQSLK